MFNYKLLPNMCYWCGQVTHDDKECVVCLGRNGSLQAVDQQLEPWVRATQFHPTRKAIVDVKGYDMGSSKSISHATIGVQQGLHSCLREGDRPMSMLSSPTQRRLHDLMEATTPEVEGCGVSLVDRGDS